MSQATQSKINPLNSSSEVIRIQVGNPQLLELSWCNNLVVVRNIRHICFAHISGFSLTVFEFWICNGAINGLCFRHSQFEKVTAELFSPDIWRPRWGMCPSQYSNEWSANMGLKSTSSQYYAFHFRTVPILVIHSEGFVNTCHFYWVTMNFNLELIIHCALFTLIMNLYSSGKQCLF